jgi:hypothetical protein
MGGLFQIKSNKKITNLDGLESITELGGLRIAYMSNLVNTNGLLNLTHVKGNVTFSWNNNLTNIDGLIGLTAIDSVLILNQNRSLTNIDGLRNLNTIGGIDFNVLYATNLDALQNVNQINGDIRVTCGEITDYCGLRNALKNFNYTFNIAPCANFHPTLEDILAGNCAMN